MPYGVRVHPQGVGKKSRENTYETLDVVKKTRSEYF